ncbi:LCP family protein, partial [Candidatus Saccharibacteria bacterium]|nr:LCP family protein [Candidatus Saccharibacteria bacterium]
MVKEENTTIDGFPVRSAKDSKLVTRSRAEKIPANKKKVSTTKKRVVAKRKTATASKQVAKKAPSKISRQTKRSTSTVSREIKTEPKKVSVSKTDVMIEEEIFGATKKAHEDFLAPVESFGLDEIESDSGTSEGRVEEVEDSEVPEIKKTEKRAKEKKEKTKGKKHVVVRVILIVILLLLVGGGVAFYFWGDSILKKLTGGEGNIWSAIGAMTSETYEPLKEDSNGRTNVLVFGTSGYDMTGTNGEETHDGAQLTDSVMLMSLDQKTGDIAMVSLPRDLKVGYTCTATGKINEIYWCANMDDTNEAAGAEALEKEVEEILGVDIQYYIHLNWGSLVNIVDTLGGVTVTLDEDIDDYGWTNAKFEAGVPYTING